MNSKYKTCSRTAWVSTVAGLMISATATAMAMTAPGSELYCVAPGTPKPTSFAFVLSQGGHLIVDNQEIAALTLYTYALAGPKTPDNWTGIVGWEHKSEDAFTYRDEMSGLAIKLFDAEPGTGYLKLDSARLLKKAKSLGATVVDGAEGKYVVLKCRQGNVGGDTPAPGGEASNP